jgi:hypothetical protein
MKNAPTAYNDESAQDKRNYTVGELPKRSDTVRSAALAAMLESSCLTGMDSVFAHSTTRLSAVVYALENRYGWTIQRHDVAVDTADGRVAWVTTYWLPQETIARAFEMGFREWIESVKAARAKRRKQASKKKMAAVQTSAVRNQLRKQDPRQGALWGSQ